MINAVVEGVSDEGMARVILCAAGREPGRIIIKNGSAALDRDLPKYNKAAMHQPWVVFRDSDTDCPVALRNRLSENFGAWSPDFRLRIARRMSESWLLADADAVSEFFGVRLADVPVSPEDLHHPKRALISLAARSRLRAVRYDMVAGGERPGPLYATRVNEFAATLWCVERASERSDSLRRAVLDIRSLP